MNRKSTLYFHLLSSHLKIPRWTSYSRCHQVIVLACNPILFPRTFFRHRLLWSYKLYPTGSCRRDWTAGIATPANTRRNHNRRGLMFGIFERASASGRRCNGLIIQISALLSTHLGRCIRKNTYPAIGVLQKNKLEKIPALEKIVDLCPVKSVYANIPNVDGALLTVCKCEKCFAHAWLFGE